MKIFFLLLFLTTSLIPLPPASAQGIDFEAPFYTAGAFSTQSPANSATTPVGFTSQGGWSSSTGSDGGQIVMTASSGLYSGGQALGTTAATGTTYTGS